MKNWILIVFKLLPGLEKRIEKCDRAIERIALSPFGDTSAQYGEILSQMEKKSKLINLSVMFERLKDALDKSDFFLLCKYAAGVPVGELSESLGVKQSTLYKKLRRAFELAAKKLESDGYTEARLEQEYLVFPTVRTLYGRLNRAKA